MSFPHINTHGRRPGTGFHRAPLRRVMRDEIRRVTAPYAELCARERVDNRCEHLPLQRAHLCQAEVRTGAHRSEQSSVGVGVGETSPEERLLTPASAVNHSNRYNRVIDSKDQFTHLLNSPLVKKLLPG